MSQKTRKTADEGWGSTRARVLERDGHKCRFCGVSDEQHQQEHGRSLSAHHIIPKNDGGEDTSENLITVCMSCHRTLESTHAKAVRQMSPGLPKESLCLVRSHLHEAERDCEWFWKEELSKLSTTPKIEDRDLPGRAASPVENDDLSDREKACYVLGRINGLSQLGTHIKGCLDVVDPDVVSEKLLEEYDSPQGSFSKQSDFNKVEPW